MRRIGATLAYALLALAGAVALLAPVLAPGDPLDMVARPLVPPFVVATHPFGTDQFGRDVLAGLVHATRVSLLVGLAAAAVTVGLGSAVGLAAGLRGGLLDAALMRLTEAVQTVPPFLLALALTGVLRPSLPTVVIAIAAATWPRTARLVRAEVRRVRTLDYVAAAHLAGRHPIAVALLVVLPGALQPVTTLFGISVGEAILVESALAFLGLGDPNVLSWGSMVANGRAFVRAAPWLVLLPGASIAATVLAVSLASDRAARRIGLAR